MPKRQSLVAQISDILKRAGLVYRPVGETHVNDGCAAYHNARALRDCARIENPARRYVAAAAVAKRWRVDISLPEAGRLKITDREGNEFVY